MVFFFGLIRIFYVYLCKIFFLVFFEFLDFFYVNFCEIMNFVIFIFNKGCFCLCLFF